jgi:hypothetical protein
MVHYFFVHYCPDFLIIPWNVKSKIIFSETDETIVQGWLAVHNVVDVGGVIPVHVYAGSKVPAKVLILFF